MLWRFEPGSASSFILWHHTIFMFLPINRIITQLFHFLHTPRGPSFYCVCSRLVFVAYHSRGIVSMRFLTYCRGHRVRLQTLPPLTHTITPKLIKNPTHLHTRTSKGQALQNCLRNSCFGF